MRVNIPNNDDLKVIVQTQFVGQKHTPFVTYEIPPVIQIYPLRLNTTTNN